jgi:hypothetical protein
MNEYEHLKDLIYNLHTLDLSKSEKERILREIRVLERKLKVEGIGDYNGTDKYNTLP